MTHNFRKGDIVTVRATVRYSYEITGDGRLSIDLGIGNRIVTVDLVDVQLAVPHFDVGDVVVIGDTGHRATVLGTCADHVWVRTDGGYATILALDLRLADASEAIDPSLIETPPSAPYIAGVEDRTGGTLADRPPDLPHLADALADF